MYQVDPKKLLEEGLRRELVTRVATALNNILTFSTKTKDRVGDLSAKLTAMGRVMEAFRGSFEYIQDYINIPGLRLWQEEISRSTLSPDMVVPALEGMVCFLDRWKLEIEGNFL